MRWWSFLLATGVCVFVSAAGAQQSTPVPAGPAAPAAQGGVQVGVPGGGRGQAAPEPPAGGGRRGRGPAAPAPRSPNGRVLLQGRTLSEKGVWLPDGVVTT